MSHRQWFSPNEAKSPLNSSSCIFCQNLTAELTFNPSHTIYLFFPKWPQRLMKMEMAGFYVRDQRQVPWRKHLQGLKRAVLQDRAAPQGGKKRKTAEKAACNNSHSKWYIQHCSQVLPTRCHILRRTNFLISLLYLWSLLWCCHTSQHLFLIVKSLCGVCVAVFLYISDLLSLICSSNHPVQTTAAASSHVIVFTRKI